MKAFFLPISAGLMLASLAGCSIFSPFSSSASSTATPSVPLSGYEPQLEDGKLQRDRVFLEVENSSLVIRESFPVQVSVILNGSLADPCHQLRVVVSPPGERNEVRLQVYSVYDPGEVCITVIQPFTATIPLGAFSAGHFTVFVNDKPVGEFDA